MAMTLDTESAVAGKKSIWDSIRSNPKLVFIAFFASYVLPSARLILMRHSVQLTKSFPGSAASSMAIKRAFSVNRSS